MSLRTSETALEELENRVSYRISRKASAHIASCWPRDLNRQVECFEDNKNSFLEDPSYKGWYIGEKPAPSPPTAPVQRKNRAHYINLGDTTIAVLVGRTTELSKAVNVHQSVLCASSEFFKAKARPEWSNGQATVDLQHISAGAFTMYANWAYGGKIVHNGRDLNEKVIPDNTATLPVKDDWQALAEAVVLGEELIDSAFKHSVLDTIAYVVATLQRIGGDSAVEVMYFATPIQVIYDGTPEGSGARRFLVNLVKCGDNFLEKCEDGLPETFLRDLAMQLLKGEDKDHRGLLNDPCWYHQHAEGEACYSTTARDWKAEIGDKFSA